MNRFMSARTHDQSSFFKFSTVSTALKVIEGQSFRWSSPTAFNDPFDHQAGFVLNQNPQRFAKELSSSMERMIYSDLSISEGVSSQFRAQLLQMRMIRNRFSRDALRTEMLEIACKSAELMHSGFTDFNAQILTQINHSRVFCVSESNNNVVMWSHYADEHRGVTFELGCVDSIDNTLLCAKPVVYSDTFVAFPGEQRYAQHVTGESHLNIPALAASISYRKHSDWAYEREWRVSIPMLDNPTGNGFTFYSEQPAVFLSVTLGCRIPALDQRNVVESLSKHLPNTKILKAVRSSSKFELTFEPLV